MATYNHTQTGTLTRVTLGVVFLAALVGAIVLGARDPQAGLTLGVVSAVVFIALLLFHSLTVEIASGYLRMRLGIGLIRKEFRIRDIEEAESVRLRWWYGWGIRLTPHGWLFSVSGREGVRLRLQNGRRYTIGTDEPDKLVAAIEASRRFS